MSIYNAASHEELRKEVIALCMEAIDESRFNSCLPRLTCAERIVPPVKKPEPVYKEVWAGPYIVTYRGGETPWMVVSAETGFTVSFGTLAGAIDSHITPDDIVLAALLDLKASPTERAA